MSVIVDHHVLEKPEQYLAFRAFSGSQSLVLQAKFLQSFLEQQAVEFQITNFAELSTPVQSGNSAPKKPKKKEIGSAKTDGNIILF